MSTTHNYTAAEMAPLDDRDDISRRANAAGYTDPYIGDNWVGLGPPSEQELVSWDVTVDEDGVDKATLLADIKAAASPFLTLSAASLEVPADGVSTGSVDIAGPAGGTVSLGWDGVIPAAQTQVVLDGAGEGTAVFGPAAAPWITSKPSRVTFSLEVVPPIKDYLDLTFTPSP